MANPSAMMLGLVVIVGDGLMNVSQLKQTLLNRKSSIIHQLFKLTTATFPHKTR